jgi:2-polyprenyl-3-methyl-5-hydroxy-6-metoxy-1,4-benzoquinol methylase
VSSSESLEHDEYDLIEEAFNDAVSVSLAPRGPDVMYEVIAGLGLDEGASVVDLGCGEGRHTIELARRFSLRVQGIDPLDRRLDVGRKMLALQPSAVTDRVTFRVGGVEAIPASDESVDVILCREMLYVVVDVVAALAECRRIAKPRAKLVVYQLFSTDWLEPREAAWFWGGVDAAERSRAEFFEVSAASADWAIADMLDLRSETVEWAEEHTGKACREVMAAARLLRDPDRYIEQFGRAAYDIKLNDAYWFVYRMIGKLTQRIYVLSPL